MEITFVDWVGYIASAIVFVSFLYKDVKTIRVINMIGAAVFVVYGVMLKTAYPIIAFNGGIILLHVYHLLIKKNNE